MNCLRLIANILNYYYKVIPVISFSVFLIHLKFINVKTVINFGTAFITKSERFFKNPLKFDPNRWEREEAGTELIDPYSNLSFG